MVKVVNWPLGHFVIRIEFGDGSASETIRHTQDGVQKVIDHIFAELGSVQIKEQFGGIKSWTVTKEAA